MTAPSDALLRRLGHIVVALSLIAIALHVIAAAAVGNVWDDGYMFARYAHNLLSHGAIAWNDGPTYGLTSLTQLIFTAPVLLVTGKPGIAAMIGSIIPGVLFIVSIPWLAASALPRDAARWTIGVLSVGLVALGAPILGIFFANGMDTMLAVLFVSLYLGLMLRAAREIPSRRYAIVLGIFGALAYFVRPDLLLCTALVPLALALWSREKKMRDAAWFMLGATAVLLIVFLILLWMYFGTAVPLAFYAKVGHLYGPTIGKRFAFLPLLEFVAFLDAYKFAFLPVAVLIALGYRKLFQRGDHAIWIGIVAFVISYIVYFLFFVLQIMGYDGRFYFPVLPALVACGAFSIDQLFNRYQEHARHLTTLLLLLMLAGLFTPLAWGVEALGHAITREPAEIGSFWSGDLPTFFQASGGAVEWPCLDVFAQLPDDAVLATTEVGLPSAIAPDKRIIDLAGLNDAEIAISDQGVAEAVLGSKADLVYLPSEQYYPEQRSAILSSAAFDAQYKVYSMESLGTLSDVAVRTDSPYAPALTACLDDIEQSHASSTALSTDADAEYYNLPLPYPLLK